MTHQYYVRCLRGPLTMVGGLVLVLGLIAGGHAGAQMSMPNGGAMGHGHGADGTGHNMHTMPGLRGLDATAQESAEMMIMFRNFRKLNRTVTQLPDGIHTVTWSEDPEVIEALVSHVVGMVARVEEGRDPQVFIQSPTLDIFFARHERITSDLIVTDAGIEVIQTSSDPELVEALQSHAAEVTDMVNRGMHAVHERMMRQGGQ